MGIETDHDGDGIVMMGMTALGQVHEKPPE